MTYIVDTHVFAWLLDKNKRLSQKYKEILLNNNNTFIISAIVLAEIKHLISVKRININFETVIEYLSECDNCTVYPVNEDVVEHMPEGLDIHDGIIVATGLIYKNFLGDNLFILTEDETIRNSGILPVA
ncbi:MAG: PIN domain-containing protein [Nitrospirota bacterium]